MEFTNKFKEISESIPNKIDFIKTEESTKTAFILPFINALGYDYTDPSEVVPEFVADIGTKKGEKVDYGIIIDNEPVILIECKNCHSDLYIEHASQLHRYFMVTPARFAILTNGIKYQFYSDIDNKHEMDSKPFLEIDMLNLKEHLINQLKVFTKSTFDLDNTLSVASGLKYKTEIKKSIENQINDPNDDFVKFFTKQVYGGAFTNNIKNQFKPIVKSSFNEFIKEKVDNRLKTALDAPETDLKANTEIIGKKSINNSEKLSDGKKVNYKGKRLSYFSFDGNEFKSVPWINMLIEITAIISNNHKNDFNKVLTLKGRLRPYFSLNPDDLRNPKLINGTEIFMESNLSANSIVNISKNVLNIFGYDEKDLIIKTE